MNTAIELGSYLQRSPDLADVPEKVERNVEVRAAKQAVLNLLRPFRNSNDIRDVLDIGSGRGWSAKRLLAMFPCLFTVDCVVLYQEEVMALNVIQGLTPLLAIQEAMPQWWSDKFNLVRASHVLEHSPAPVVAMTEYARVLAPDGLLQIVMPSAHGYTGLTTDSPKRIGDSPHHPFCASSETIIEMLRHVGLVFDSYHEIPQTCNGMFEYHHRVWMARKPC